MDDFEAALAAKVAAQPLEDEVEATTTEEAAPVETENVAEEVAIEEAPERPAWLPEQFKTEADFVKSWSEAQTLIGRQGQELGDLRKAVEEVAQGQREPQPYGQLQEALEENPKAVAMWAYENGNQEVYEQAINSWYEKGLDEQDPRVLREVGQFERAVEMSEFQNQLSSTLGPALEGVKGESEVRALALAQRELRSQYSDFDQVMESVEESDVAGLDAKLIRQLKESDPKKALETIYRWVAAGKQVEASSASDERKAEVLEEKRKAVVASSTSSPVEGTKSGKDLLKEFMLEPDAHSVHHGLVRD